MLIESIQYLLRDKDLKLINVGFGLADKQDGDGLVIEWWNPSIMGMNEPTEAELLADEATAQAWVAGTLEISYYDFFELLPINLQIAVTNEAERRLALPTPDSEMMVILRKTYDKSLTINLQSANAVGIMATVLGKLVTAGVLTEAQSLQWQTLQPVTA